MSAQRLEGKVVLVTGASRGGGKGIALVLGERGATVYVSGRSVRGEPTTLGRPGTIDDTAEELTALGGTDVDGKQQSTFRDEHWAGTWGT